MRKAFNFFISYWKTANELNNKDRLAFYDALLYYQFTGDKSKLNSLTGLAKFAFISQENSIDTQIKGYLDKCNSLKIKPFDNPTEAPTQPPAGGGSQGPWQQEKEKEKEKEEEKEPKKQTPNLEEIKIYFLENGFTKESAKKFFDYYSAGNWKDSKGNPVKNWKQKALAVWFKDENKLNLNPPVKKTLQQQAQEAHDKQINRFK